MTSLRTKGKSTIVWILLGMLLLGLGGFGVRNFSGGAVGSIGSVGDTDIGTDDYLRGIRSEMQGFAAQTGQNITAEQARTMGLPLTVQARLFTAAALEDEARRVGLSVGDEAVLRQLTQAPGFQGQGGNFDNARYTDVLRREGLTPAAFEEQVRMDEARMILQRAAIGGLGAPVTLRDRTAGWLLETRDLSWAELTPAQLKSPVTQPDEATLEAWHQANAAEFTAPEVRKITYAWLTPEMLADTVQLDEAALREIYQQRIAEFQQPERRMVEQLVYPDAAAATAAKARLDAGQANFEQLAAERGLQLSDIDLGEVTEAALGAAGPAVFALDQPGVVGPVETALGPALISMNAILEPVNIPFEQAQADLRAEAAADRAKRLIEDQAAQLEDLIAGGATLEDLAKDTPMEVGSIDFSADTPAGGIAAYQSFRERAAQLTDKDFPQIYPLDDGGVFALRLDAVVPPTLRPFAEVRTAVLDDWTAAETRRQLKALAQEEEMQLSMAPAADGAAAPGLPVTLTPAPAVERDTGIEGVPGDVTAAAFRLKAPGDTDVVEADGRVFVIRLDAVHPADLGTVEAAPVLDGVSRRLGESLQGDVFEAYARALQTTLGVTINTPAIAAANARIQ